MLSDISTIEQDSSEFSVRQHCDGGGDHEIAHSFRKKQKQMQRCSGHHKLKNVFVVLYSFTQPLFKKFFCFCFLFLFFAVAHELQRATLPP